MAALTVEELKALPEDTQVWYVDVFSRVNHTNSKYAISGMLAKLHEFYPTKQEAEEDLKFSQLMQKLGNVQVVDIAPAWYTAGKILQAKNILSGVVNTYEI